jgi:putative membrane protein
MSMDINAVMSAVSVAASWSDGGWPHNGWYGGYGWPWPGLIWLVIAILFWAGLLALLVWAVRSSVGSRRQPPDTAREVLQRRLAAGEISEEEYERIKRLLWE